MEGQQEGGWEEHLTPQWQDCVMLNCRDKIEASPLTKNIQNGTSEHEKSRTGIAALPSLSSLFTTLH